MMQELAKLFIVSGDTTKQIYIVWQLTEMVREWQLEGMILLLALICCSADHQVIIWKSDFKPEAKYEQKDSI